MTDAQEKYDKNREIIRSLSDEQFRDIVRNNNYAEIKKILGVSCTIWKPELLKRGLDLKSVDRINKYPDLTLEQIRLITGGMLGDGGIEKSGKTCSRYFESHAPNQSLYLRKKHDMLKPFSRDIYVDEAYDDLFCYRFTTISHPHFKKFGDLFYEPGLKGKLIPLDYLRSIWHDDILAYWFLDDGHFDEKSGCYTIANKCPKIEQLDVFMAFLSEYYQASFYKYVEKDIYSVKIPFKIRDRFIKIILNVATDDMLYKIPASYRNQRKIEIQQQESQGSQRIKDIKTKITLGHTYEELKKEYPITPALFLRLGGIFPKIVTSNHKIVADIISNEIDSNALLDEEIIIGTILGDGNIFKYGKDTCVFSFAHSVDQSSYVKLKYELLKTYVNRIRYLKNTSNDFYSFHVILKALKEFSDYYKLFYTAKKEGKENPQKYLFRKEIIDLITPRAFAFWLMDDGKKYGSGRYMFSITIAKQPYYKHEDYIKFVGSLNDKLGFNLNPREEKISYEITTTTGKAEDVFHKLKDYIWPYFSYKFGVAKSDCGLIYRSLPWFSTWEE
jgi:LAGLIDADG DNA endonuclease family